MLRLAKALSNLFSNLLLAKPLVSFHGTNAGLSPLRAADRVSPGARLSQATLPHDTLAAAFVNRGREGVPQQPVL